MTPTTSSDQAALVALSARANRAHRLAQAIGPDGAPRLDAIVDSARAALATGGVHLSLLTDRQITASTGAVDTIPRGTETPFDDTICANALRSNEPVVIDDTARDSRVSSIPAVVSGAVGAYLGMPVRVDHSVVGVLCVFDDAPRQWTELDRAQLQSYTRDIEKELVRLDPAAARDQNEV